MALARRHSDALDDFCNSAAFMAVRLGIPHCRKLDSLDSSDRRGGIADRVNYRDAERLFDFTGAAIGTLLVWLPPKSGFGVLYRPFTSLASFSSISLNACCKDLV